MSILIKPRADPRGATAIVTTSRSASPSPVAHHLQSLYIGRANGLHAAPAAGCGSLASDANGTFSFTYTFGQDVHLGGALVLSCWMDAASVERGRFCAALSQRTPPNRAGWHQEDQPLPCITGYMREPGQACDGAMLQVALTMTTRPTAFMAGDQLVLRLTLTPPKGSDAVMGGTMYYGANAASVLTFSTVPVTPHPASAR